MVETRDAPPRRYSVVDDLTARGGRAVGPQLRIKLDGKPVSRVRHYDQDAGTVTRILTDEHGKPVIDHLLGVVKEETLRGAITVEWRDK